MADSAARRVIAGVALVIMLGVGYIVYANRPSARELNTLERMVSEGSEEARRVRELYALNKDCLEEKRTLVDPQRNAECIPVMEEILAQMPDQEKRSTDALVAIRDTQYASLESEDQKLIDNLIMLHTSAEYIAFYEGANELSQSILSFRKYIASKNHTRESLASDPAAKTYMDAIDASEKKAEDTHQNLIAYVQSNFSGEYGEFILRSLGADTR